MAIVDADILSHNLKDLEENDQNFLKSIQEKTVDSNCGDDHMAFNFWILIFLFLLVCIIVAFVAVHIVKHVKNRRLLSQMGYA